VVVHDAGVGRGGEGGDPAVADAVVEELRAAGGTALPSYENLRSEDACARVIDFAVAEFGRLDVLVNNAGLVVYEEIEEADRSWEIMRRVPRDEASGLRTARLHDVGHCDVCERHAAGTCCVRDRQDGHFGLMVVLAAEGRDHGVLSNAISPVAATRVYTRAAEPGELEPEPEQVAPGVLFLASEAYPVTGLVLAAAGGRFAIRWWARGREIDFGREPVEPEQIAELWAAIDAEGS
jgi:NAD(P)-dependent dehydrogenase (short-subunit alcohol dehydrogenase family)